MATTYKIGEAAALLNLKTYVLRFWETEFPQIAPLRTEKGQRLYTDEHLALLRRIRFLLHERGLTIEGARKVLAEEAAKGTPPAKAAVPAFPMPHAARNKTAPKAGPEALPQDVPHTVRQPLAQPHTPNPEVPPPALAPSPRSAPPAEGQEAAPPSPAPAEGARRDLAKGDAGLYSALPACVEAAPEPGVFVAAHTPDGERPHTILHEIATELEHVIAQLRGGSPGNTLQ